MKHTKPVRTAEERRRQGLKKGGGRKKRVKKGEEDRERDGGKEEDGTGWRGANVDRERRKRGAGGTSKMAKLR